MKQMELSDVLSDKEPQTNEEPDLHLKQEPEPQAKTEQPEKQSSTVEEDRRSVRQKHQDKEMDARGMDRDPATGQFVSKSQEKEAKTEDAGQKDKSEPEKKEAPVKEEKVAAPQQEPSAQEKAYLAAMQDERRKRQALEKRLADLEATKKDAEPSKTFWDDPEAVLKGWEQRMQESMTKTRLETAETIARSKYNDFDDNVQVFADLVGKTPGLHQQWLASSDPAEFAYRTGKNHRELQEAGSIDALRARIEKETRLKVEAELKAKREREITERASIPPSLSEARGTAQQNRAVWGGPTPLDKILE